jgi:hypothetical protein
VPVSFSHHTWASRCRALFVSRPSDVFQRAGSQSADIGRPSQPKIRCEYVSINGRTIAPRGTRAQWLDDAHAIYAAERDGRWILETFDVASNQAAVLDFRGCNELAAGGGRWIVWLAGVGLFGDLGDRPLAGVSPTNTDGRGASSRDVVLAIVPNRSAGDAIELQAPDRTVKRFAPAVYGLHILSASAAVWTRGSYGLTLSPLLPNAINLKPVTAPDGRLWWVYWTDTGGLVAHPSGSFVGHVIEKWPRVFHHDAVVTPDGRLVVADSTGVEERPEELVRIEKRLDAPGCFARRH